MNVQTIAAVAFGGAIGSVARYLVGVEAGKLLGLNFPWGTLIINVTGSMALGILAELFALRWNADEATRIFLTIGLCGGFTTFSAFSLDTVTLINRGEVGTALSYVIASVILSVLALFAGLYLVRAVT